VAKRRAALRAQGLRPKQIWIPDLRRADVRESIEREAQAIARADELDGIMAFIDSISILNELPPHDGPEYE
jgi:hypothetical protein